MKRMHLHVGVSDIDTSVRFYSALFAAEPIVLKADYAKWMLEDPRINFAISNSNHTAKGIEHIGIQAETASELEEVFDRLRGAGRPVLEEGATTCCYAQSEKNWITDPDGVIWEAFLTNGEATVYGDKIDLTSATAAEDQCCSPVSQQAECSPPMPELTSDAPCCGVAA